MAENQTLHLISRTPGRGGIRQAREIQGPYIDRERPGSGAWRSFQAQHSEALRILANEPCHGSAVRTECFITVALVRKTS